MSQQTIDTSTQTDLLYQGLEKVNENFTEVYASIVQTGMMIDYWGTSAPSGWVLADGSTIGNASSGASRANADTELLFTLLWGSLTNAEAPVSSGRGASASADFSANKTITIPNLRGRVAVGQSSSGTFSTLGTPVGSETHTLTESELPVVANHTHGLGIYNGFGGAGSASVQGVTDGSNGSLSTDAGGGFGSGTAHNNIQPSIVCNKIIKL